MSKGRDGVLVLLLIDEDQCLLKVILRRLTLGHVTWVLLPFESTVVILQCLLHLTKPPIAQAAMAIMPGVLRVKLDAHTKVGDGTLVLLHRHETSPPSLVVLRIGRPELNRLAQDLDACLVLLHSLLS